MKHLGISNLKTAVGIKRAAESLSPDFKEKSFLGRVKMAMSLAWLLLPGLLMAQPKVSSTTAMESSIKTESTSMINIAKILVGVVLAITLVVIIYKISQGSNGAKEALIGWIVGVVVYCVACLVI